MLRSGQFIDKRLAAAKHGSCRLQFRIGHRDRCQQACRVHGRQFLGVSAIGLYSIATAARNRGGGDDLALDLEISKLSKKDEAARRSLVAAARLSETRTNTLNQSGNSGRLILQLLLEEDFSGGNIEDTSANCVFVNIEPDEYSIGIVLVIFGIHGTVRLL
jgi:hypothetical protein